MRRTTEPTPCNCLALRQAARQVTQLYDAELASCGLRTTQYSLLSVLDRTGGSTMKELAEALVMDRSTLGHNLRPLEREGLVLVRADDRDKRARALQLTETGRARLKDARRFWARAQARFHDGYGEEDARRMRALLGRVVETVTRASP